MLSQQLYKKYVSITTTIKRNTQTQHLLKGQKLEHVKEQKNRSFHTKSYFV